MSKITEFLPQISTTYLYISLYNITMNKFHHVIYYIPFF